MVEFNNKKTAIVITVSNFQDITNQLKSKLSIQGDIEVQYLDKDFKEFMDWNDINQLYDLVQLKVQAKVTVQSEAALTGVHKVKLIGGGFYGENISALNRIGSVYEGTMHGVSVALKQLKITSEIAAQELIMESQLWKKLIHVIIKFIV